MMNGKVSPTTICRAVGLRLTYLYSCRILQWSAERLPIDRRSCLMRGMPQSDWYRGCNLLISAGVLDSRLAMTDSTSEALAHLKKHYRLLLAEFEQSECESAAESTRKHNEQECSLLAPKPKDTRMLEKHLSTHSNLC